MANFGYDWLIRHFEAKGRQNWTIKNIFRFIVE